MEFLIRSATDSLRPSFSSLLTGKEANFRSRVFVSLQLLSVCQFAWSHDVKTIVIKEDSKLLKTIQSLLGRSSISSLSLTELLSALSSHFLSLSTSSSIY